MEQVFSLFQGCRYQWGFQSLSHACHAPKPHLESLSHLLSHLPLQWHCCLCLSLGKGVRLGCVHQVSCCKQLICGSHAAHKSAVGAQRDFTLGYYSWSLSNMQHVDQLFTVNLAQSPSPSPFPGKDDGGSTMMITSRGEASRGVSPPPPASSPTKISIPYQGCYRQTKLVTHHGYCRHSFWNYNWFRYNWNLAAIILQATLLLE